MITLKVRLHVQKPVAVENLLMVLDSGEATVHVVDDGCVSGRPAVMFEIPTPDGTVVFQTSLRMLMAAAAIMGVAYNDVISEDSCD